jgi:hypothetical protein
MTAERQRATYPTLVSWSDIAIGQAFTLGIAREGTKCFKVSASRYVHAGADHDRYWRMRDAQRDAERATRTWGHASEPALPGMTLEDDIERLTHAVQDVCDERLLYRSYLRHPYPPAEEIRAVCAKLYTQRDDVRMLVAKSDFLAKGVAVDHPGFLRKSVKAHRAVKRLLASLGVLQCRDYETLRAIVQRDARIAVDRWDRGDAEGDLAEEWDEAIDRCRSLCASHRRGHLVQAGGPFTRADVLEVMRGTSTWVGEIHYGSIRRLLLEEAVDDAGE